MSQEQPKTIGVNQIPVHDDPEGRESPVLAAVRQHEIELKTELLKTRQAADEILAQARAEAAAVRDNASVRARQKAGKIADGEIAATNAEADHVREAADQAVQELTAAGKKNFDQAVTFVIEAVLPKLGKEVGNVLEDDQN